MASSPWVGCGFERVIHSPDARSFPEDESHPGETTERTVGEEIRHIWKVRQSTHSTSEKWLQKAELLRRAFHRRTCWACKGFCVTVAEERYLLASSGMRSSYMVAK